MGGASFRIGWWAKILRENKLTEREVLRAAIRKYGHDAQLHMLAEECGELVQKVMKVFRASNHAKREVALENMADECADVEIMLAQMREIPGIAEHIQRRKGFKMMRHIGRRGRLRQGGEID